MPTPTISPTDVEFYDGHTDEALETLARRTAEQGLTIAATHGADHPLAAELAAMLAAITGQQLARDEWLDEFDEGPTCSICDALGHGYPGGRPCPLEDR